MNRVYWSLKQCISVFVGVFLMVAGGIIAGIILIVIEIAYKRHRGLKDKELELARNAADRWRGNIEVGHRQRPQSMNMFCIHSSVYWGRRGGGLLRSCKFCIK